MATYNEETGNGWQNVNDVKSLFNRIYEYNYELKNCIRGESTGCTTNEELANLLRTLADEMNDLAENLQYIKPQIGIN